MGESKKRNPRFPSFPLDDALGRAKLIYEKEGLIEMSPDVAAQHMGYSSSRSGSALSAIGTLKYFGLLYAPSQGNVAVADSVQAYFHDPDEQAKQGCLREWLKGPRLFNDLLSDYPDRLPSEANLKFALMKKGFAPKGAEQAAKVFVSSVEFVRYYESKDIHRDRGDVASTADMPSGRPGGQTETAGMPNDGEEEVGRENQYDKIPIRLSGGRRAWLIVPCPFFERDKKRVIDQVNLILADDSEGEPGHEI